MDNILDLIEKIRIYGTINKVPIMSKETIDTINDIINKNSFNSILEIGTAIAYSTINFANNKNIKKITSIERDEERYIIAISNVKKSKLSNIELIYADALKIDIKQKYDLIIIDAAKAQNINFFNKYKNNLNENGIIIIDNLQFHGFVGNSSKIKSKNLRQLVQKIEKFIDFLNNNDEYDVKYIEVGDRLGVCKKKK